MWFTSARIWKSWAWTVGWWVFEIGGWQRMKNGRWGPTRIFMHKPMNTLRLRRLALSKPLVPWSFDRWNDRKDFFWEKKAGHEFDEVAFCWLFWWLLISSCYWFDCELNTNRNSINNMNWRCQQHVCRGPPCHSCCIELRLPLVRRWPKAHSNVFSALWLQYGDETTTCPLLRISLVHLLYEYTNEEFMSGS